MRHFFWTGVVLATGLMMPLALPMQAQMGAQGGGAGGGQGRQRGGGGGGQFGGGQRVEGTVTAIAGNKVTIQTDAGDTYTVTVAGDARVMRDRQPIKASDVKVGDSVTAVGTVDATAKTVAATIVMDVDAATVKKAKEDMGKTYITGKITAIDVDNLKLTVMRTDNVSQVIAVDEGTSFQRGARGITVPSMMGGGGGLGGGRGGAGGGNGGAAVPAPVESITLADIKVGDTVVATGGLKGGVFVPAKMGVSAGDTAAGGGRRRGGAAAGGQTGGPPGTSAAPAVPATPPAGPQ
jgi:hypothetical protein